MPSTEHLPLEQIKDVDWTQLTEEQAASLALSLGMFNDAIEQLNLAKTAFFARASGTLVAAGVGAIASTWTHPMAAVVGMIVALSLGTFGAWWGTRRCRKAVEEAKQTVLADFGTLPRG